MKFKLLNYIYHGKSEKKRLSVFSIDIQPFGNLVVTCGQDSLIKIWKICSHLKIKYQNRNFLKIRKKIQQNPYQILENHINFANIVRWSIDGKRFASGGDDGCLLIYENSKNPGFHTLWRVYHKFKNHTGDIIDLAWCVNSILIASASLDNFIYIWTIEKKCLLIKLTGHGGWIKGICWDPNGRFLASQSDDKKVIIWKSSSWKAIKKIKVNSKKPFNHKELRSNFFSRLSWSTCGRYILICNTSFNQKSAIFIIDRSKNFKNQIYITGYKFASRIIRCSFRIYKNSFNEKINSYFSTGTTDGILGIWSILNLKAFVYIKFLSKSQILDISWGSSGKYIIYCSFNGLVFFMTMSYREIGKTLKIKEHYNFLNRYYITLKQKLKKFVLTKFFYKNFKNKVITKNIKKNVQVTRNFHLYNLCIYRTLIFCFFYFTTLGFNCSNYQLLKREYNYKNIYNFSKIITIKKLNRFHFFNNFNIIKKDNSVVIVIASEKKLKKFYFNSSPILFGKKINFIYFLMLNRKKYFNLVFLLKNQPVKCLKISSKISDIFLNYNYTSYIDCFGNLFFINMIKHDKILLVKKNFRIIFFLICCRYFLNLKLFLHFYKCSGMIEFNYYLWISN